MSRGSTLWMASVVGEEKPLYRTAHKLGGHFRPTPGFACTRRRILYPYHCGPVMTFGWQGGAVSAIGCVTITPGNCIYASNQKGE